MTVYVAGPMTRGDQAINVREGILAGMLLLAQGHTPFIPHLSWFAHFLEPREYEMWLEYDIRWLEKCEALVRLPGYSIGADREVSHAINKGIPVYYGTEEFLTKTKEKR